MKKIIFGTHALLALSLLVNCGGTEKDFKDLEDELCSRGCPLTLDSPTWKPNSDFVAEIAEGQTRVNEPDLVAEIEVAQGKTRVPGKAEIGNRAGCPFNNRQTLTVRVKNIGGVFAGRS